MVLTVASLVLICEVCVYLSVCACVFMCQCVHVRACIHVCVRAGKRVHSCKPVCAYISLCPCMCANFVCVIFIRLNLKYSFDQ